jgi:uncharacterized protein YndB with AHSA1/START domain
MTDQLSAAGPRGASAHAVRRSVTVQGQPDHAFAVFTDGLSSWWPLHTHTIGAQAAAAAIIEPRAGGRWFERAADGSETDWGRVLAWEPPDRVVLSWEISCDWHPDPTIATEVEVTFHAEDGDRTRVELEHRHLELYGDQAEQMRSIFGSSEGGWGGLLQRFAGAAAAS